MPLRWTTADLRRFVGDGYVVLLDRQRRRLPLPAGLRDRPVQRGVPLWDTGLAQVHGPDRIGVVRAYREAFKAPGTIRETTFRGRQTGTWGRFRLRFLNVLDQPDLGAFVTVVDRFEPLATDDGTWAPAASPTREVPSVVIRCDLSATVIHVEGAVEQLYGVSHDDLLRRSALDFVHPDDIPACLDAGIALLADPQSEVRHSHRVCRPDGTVRQVNTCMRSCGRDDGTWELEVRDAASVLHNDVLTALRRDEFHLVYQPLVEPGAARPLGAEALLRWAHPHRGLVLPTEFIPVAEATGVIVDIGAWVLHMACREATRWGDDLYVSVNLSARQLGDAGIVATVAESLAASGLAPERLVLEVTESALIEEPNRAISHLWDLKALGVRLAIDDFGTGYSSLLYLKRMPVDALKIDRCFVSGLGEDTGDRAIVTSVIALAHALGIDAIGEGVETTDQLRHLTTLGCDGGQGYLWSRPVPPAELHEFLRGWSHPPTYARS